MDFDLPETKSKAIDKWYDKLGIVFLKLVLLGTPIWFMFLGWLIIISVFVAIRRVIEPSLLGITIDAIIVVSAVLLGFYMYLKIVLSLSGLIEKIKKVYIGTITLFVVSVILAALVFLVRDIAELIANITVAPQ